MEKKPIFIHTKKDRLINCFIFFNQLTKIEEKKTFSDNFYMQPEFNNRNTLGFGKNLITKLSF